MLAQTRLPDTGPALESLPIAPEDASKRRHGPRLLFADTETSPSITYAWSYWNTSITADKVIKPSELIAWSALWYDPEDNAEVMFRSVHHDGKDMMVEEIWHLLDDADILCCFNTRFDAAKLNHAFLLAGLPPPSPYKKLCLLQACKKVFSFTHNSLRNVLSVLGLDEQKMENEGFALWVKCLEGDEQAWADMRAYSIQDTAVLRGLYLRGHLIRNDPCLSRQGDISVSEVPHFRCLT